MNPSQQALAAWQRCLSQLSPGIAAVLEMHPTDTKPLSKHGHQVDIMRLRILPKRGQRQPAHFWNGDVCFYEIGVGTYDGKASILGGISFLQFSDQQRCGGGVYHDPVVDILKSLHKKRPNFEIRLRAYNQKSRKPELCRHYEYPDFKTFPVMTAGDDLAWLISESFPQFISF